jgi:UDP-2,3-diacylglucosamine pyrophosphatase LpxH
MLRSIRLPAEGSYLLLSDLHLGNGGPTDEFGRNDRALLDLLEAWLPRTDAIVLNGDVLDALQAKRPARIRTAHSAVLGRLQEISRRLPVCHVIGNHDNVAYVDRLLPGVRRCSSVRIGDEALVVHGHEFDAHYGSGPLTGRGGHALRAHRFVERMTGQLIRVPFAQYPNPVNCFSHWMFYRVTMAAYLVANALARLGRPDPLRRWAAHHDYWARSQWGDNQALLIPALATLATGRFRVLVTGHSHQAGLVDRFDSRPAHRVTGEPDLEWRTSRERCPPTGALKHRVFCNLGSWTFGRSSYGLWNRGELGLFDWENRKPIGDRAYRIALGSVAIPGMREWWRRYYRGFLRYDLEAIRRDLQPVPPRMPGKW